MIVSGSNMFAIADHSEDEDADDEAGEKMYSFIPAVNYLAWLGFLHVCV